MCSIFGYCVDFKWNANTSRTIFRLYSVHCILAHYLSSFILYPYRSCTGRGGGSSRGGSNTSSSHEGRGGSRGGSRGGGSGGSSRSSSRGGSSRRGGRGGRSSRGDRNATPYSRPSRNSAFGGSKDTGRGGRGGSSRGRGGGRGGRGGGSGDRGPSTILCISGYGSDVKFEDVQKFLTSALGRQFRYIKVQWRLLFILFHVQPSIRVCFMCNHPYLCMVKKAACGCIYMCAFIRDGSVYVVTVSVKVC